MPKNDGDVIITIGATLNKSFNNTLNDVGNNFKNLSYCPCKSLQAKTLPIVHSLFLSLSLYIYYIIIIKKIN